MESTGLSSRSADKADLVLAADFTQSGDKSYRFAEEIRALADHGRSLTLLQIRKPLHGQQIAPEIQTCLRRNIARAHRSDTALHCRTLILHQPGLADLQSLGPDRLQSSETLFICHEADDVAAAREIRGTETMARIYAVNSFLRTQSATPEDIEAKNWTPAISGVWSPHPPDLPGRAPAIGWLGIGDTAKNYCLHDLSSTLPEGVEHHTLAGIKPGTGHSAHGLSLDRLLAGIEIFVVGPEQSDTDLPDTIIIAACQAGRPIVIPKWLEAHYGQGPCYYEKGDFQRVLEKVIDRLDAPSKDGSGHKADFLETCLNGPITDLFSAKVPTPRLSASDDEDRPVLFLPSNGVGVGHLTRLLAIARRIGRKAVFATQAPALEVIERFGYPAEYIPSHTAIGGGFDAWDAWFGTEINRVANIYDPALVVYDGNHPSEGLVGAVASRRDCKLAWIRRGMWAHTTSRFLKNARWCDLVIEPGELAGDRDEGVTSRLRHEAHRVDPIRLLESTDLLERNAAARALGLDPSGPNVLVQLGSGYNRDLLSLLDRIIQDLRKHSGLRIAVAEWVTGTVPLNLWPDVTILRGFPISQYLRAFDFCVSAAGYNSFHELIGFSVPTIFVANQHPSMDDQYGRAKFAQDNAAAFEISEREMSEFSDLIAMLMQREARGFLKDRCRALQTPNGAVEAAEVLDGLARQTRSIA